MEYVIGFIAGLVVGAVIFYIINRMNRKQVVDAFSTLSLEALEKNSDAFLKLANETL
ncbi:MAG: DNA recombination protein RmuC, partial [Dehalococcoidales bacterium]|nr:DNA recombination protein RmuC [Dehalococcoidales bacterium]